MHCSPRSSFILPHLKRFLPAGVVLFFLSSCSTYQDLTSYFNTYYNASRLFREAEGEALKMGQKDRDTNSFAPLTIQATTQAKFDKVIEKGSKLIQFYPQSKYVDDALLLIGKSYVYLGEYESALRKFKELQDNFPGSEHRFEAKLWSAIAQYDLKKDGEALKLVKELFTEARAEGKDDIILSTLMLQSEIFSERGEYDQAAASYSLAVEVPGDNTVRTFARYQLGLCYERMGDKAKAAEAYGKVRDHTSDLTMIFRSRLKYGMMLTASGDYHRALRVLDDLNDEDLRPEEHGLVDLEIANAYEAGGDTAQATALYNMIDTTYRRTDASAKSMYRRGVYAEETGLDYKAAQAYLSKAKTEFPGSEITPLAQTRSAALDRYFEALTNLSKYAGLYEKALHRDSSLSSAALYRRGLHRDSSSSAAEDSSLIASPQDSLSAGRPDAAELTGLPAGKSDEKPASTPPEAAREALRPPPPEAFPQGVSQALRRRFADRDSVGDDEGPFGPAGNARLAEEQDTGKDTVSGGPQSGGKRPEPSGAAASAREAALSPDSLRGLMAQSTFEVAGIYYLQLNQPDSAIAWYRKGIDEYPTAAKYVPRALYALSEIAASRHDSLAVDSLYREILRRFGTSEYGIQVKKILGMEVSEARPAAGASGSYADAESVLQSGQTQKALRLFKRLARTQDDPEISAKSQYAVGWIYESMLANNDSAAVWYERLIKQYPSTVYAQEVQPKVSVRQKPESLKEFVKVKEVPALADTTAPKSKRKQTAAERIREQNEKQNEQLEQGSDEDNQDDSSDEPDDSDDSDDDNNN